MIELTDLPIDAAELLAHVQTPAAGAAVLFVGVTRQYTDGRETTQLKYEAYRKMALGELEKLSDEAKQRWPVDRCAIVHRLGLVPLGEASVVIAVSTPHRADAFAAGEWLIDALKQRVPIWKQERWADGTAEWIHPDASTESTAR